MKLRLLITAIFFATFAHTASAHKLESINIDFTEQVASDCRAEFLRQTKKHMQPKVKCLVSLPEKFVTLSIDNSEAVKKYFFKDRSRDGEVKIVFSVLGTNSGLLIKLETKGDSYGRNNINSYKVKEIFDKYVSKKLANNISFRFDGLYRQ